MIAYLVQPTRDVPVRSVTSDETLWPLADGRMSGSSLDHSRLHTQFELRYFALEALTHPRRHVVDRGGIADNVVVTDVDAQHRAAMKARDPVCITSVQRDPVIRSC